MGLLESAGLTDAEERVYIALLELGGSTVGPLIEKTGLHRATLYDVLRRLQEKGLVGTVLEGKILHFQAQHPRVLVDLEEEKLQKLREVVPLLEQKHGVHSREGVFVFQGVRGIRLVLEDLLDELTPSGEYCDFGVSGLFKKTMGAFWFKFQQEKKRRKIKSRVIFNEGLKFSDPELLKNYFGEARFHPPENFSPTDTVIFRDTVVLFVWNANPATAIVIRNAENAKGYQNQFELLWKASKKR
ncbi:MAG: helix-turn-helix domain-containing protein [Candidatus Diapherotrites archaeon]